MWPHIRAICWAQFRITRNHLPRTSVGAFLLGLLGLIWYGMFAGLGVMFAFLLPRVPVAQLDEWLPVGLLAVFAFWQLVPLFTVSGGWSLQLHKLLPYPIQDSTLFGIEVLLRITTAPEMALVLLGGMAGLLRHPSVGWTGIGLLLFVPLNLYLSLAIREWVAQAFSRNKFREIFTILIVCISILPQILTRTTLGKRVLPYILKAANGTGTPWREVTVVSLGVQRWYFDLLLIAMWTYVCYWLARRQFEKGLRRDEALRAGAAEAGLVPERGRKRSLFGGLAEIPNRLFKDPLAALLQKEYRSLLRMPRFRVMFGMACVFSVLVFIPITLRETSRVDRTFMSNNFLIVTTLYGLLILSDSLLLNVFGFDRLAAQVYFVSPIPFRTVLVAKNLTAISFVLIQSVCVVIVASVVRVALTPVSVLNAVLAACVVGIFFLSIGNMTSIRMARPLNPAETFRKQSGGKMQLWLLLCALGMFVLVGFAFLARWALDTNWAMLGVLVVELVIGYIVYRVAMESAVEDALAQRERLLDRLSKGGAAVFGLGLS
jgi:ABC-2 type transport system permease protein